MPNYRRPIASGATWFFTVVTHERRRILCDANARTALREAVKSVRDKLPFRIDAWVLLPDHLHCIWTLPEGDRDIGKRWGLIKAQVTGALSDARELGRATPARLRRHEGTFWQRRFWEHMIRDEIDFRTHLDYVHFNPVKHGYVAKAGDWPWSTLRRYMRLGTYPPGWAGVTADSGNRFGE